MDKFDYRPGEYKVLVDRLQIRGTPDTNVNNFILNVQGQIQRLTKGQSFPVYRVITTKQGWEWGVINQDGDKDHYVCLWNLNTRFAELIKPLLDELPEVDTAIDMMIMKHERELERLKEWARTKGYTG